jgi:hypothetical protein
MTDSQLTKLAHELDNRGFGGYDITDVMACIRSVLRESKPAPLVMQDGDAHIWSFFVQPRGESVEKGGAKE